MLSTLRTVTKIPKTNVPKGAMVQKRKIAIEAIGLTACAIGGGAMFAINRYKVAEPSQYLVRTGLGIKDIKISKTGIHWPFQKYKFIS